jgi:hypothetical protein
MSIGTSTFPGSGGASPARQENDRQENAMTHTLFDILKKDRKGTFHWIEAVKDIDTAKARLHQLSAESSDEFVVFREIDLRVVATSSDK